MFLQGGRVVFNLLFVQRIPELQDQRQQEKANGGNQRGNIEDAVLALRIERLGEKYSQLVDIEEENKNCERAIAICEELIESFKERISSNNAKKELLKSRKDETKRRF